MDNLKIKLSTKILDFVEGLPRFRKGTISRLQDIRERQKDWASKEFTRRNAAKDSSVELSNITLVLTFEHEGFNSLIQGFNNYFPKIESIQEFTSDLKKSVDDLYAYSWQNLGFIAREQGIYLPGVTVDESLPQDVKSVSLSFHRILPSVACIIFEFKLDASVSKELSKIQDKVYLGPVEFKRLWPINRIHHNYSMGSGNSYATKIINDRKNCTRAEIETWIKKGFKWNPQKINAISYIDVYTIFGNPKKYEENQVWLKENRTWLSTYGIDAYEFDTLIGDDFLLSNTRSSTPQYMISNVIAKFDSSGKSDADALLEYKVKAIAVSAMIFNVIKKYKNKVETLRGNGFSNLYKRNKLTKKNQYNIQEIKKVTVIISRFEQEISHSKQWIMHSISDVGELKNLIREDTVDLGEYTLTNAEFQLKQIKEAAVIIDSGLTNYLSVQSIYVMYKLQKWMFILSIVVTIATVIGVLSGWSNLKSLIFYWFNEW